MRIDSDCLVPGSSNWVVGNVVYLLLEYGGSRFWRGGQDEFSLGHVEFETLIRSPAKSCIFQSEAQIRRQSRSDIYLRYWCIQTDHPRRAWTEIQRVQRSPEPRNQAEDMASWRRQRRKSEKGAETLGEGTRRIQNHGVAGRGHCWYSLEVNPSDVDGARPEWSVKAEVGVPGAWPTLSANSAAEGQGTVRLQLNGPTPVN